MAKKKEAEEGTKLIAKNRKAFHDFFIVEQVEAGLVLKGTEVKSLRAGHVTMDDAFARVKDGEAVLLALTIPPYEMGTYANHVPDRPRRLLLHRREIAKLAEKTNVERLTIVPLELYFKRGYCKVLLGIAKGKKLHDKRQTIREREDKKAIQRAYRGRGD
jgi:SsrA-binding protein